MASNLISEDQLARPHVVGKGLAKDRYNVGYNEEDAAHLLEYSDRAFKGDVASVLPISDEEGNIPGGNLFGRIVIGKTYRGQDMAQEPFDESLKKDFQRLMDEGESGKPVEKASADARPEPETETGDDSEPPIDSQTLFERIVSSEPQSAPAHPQPQPVSRNKPMVEASVDTPWCDVAGKYVAVIVSDDVVVMVADPEYNVFTPKPSKQKLTIRTGQESYDVVYYGMSYEYEGNVHQIYVRK